MTAHDSTLMAFVKISITEDVARALRSVKQRYPTMTDSELFRLGLAELSYKVHLEERQAWEDSLPTLQLSEKEQDELDEALRLANEEPGEPMIIDDVKKYLKELVEEPA